MVRANDALSDIRQEFERPPLAWRTYRLLIAIFIAWVLSVFLLTDGATAGLSAWISSWRQWDAEWYERIYREGYSNDAKMLVFPPLFSWVIGPASFLTGSFTSAALAVNLVAFLSAGLVMTKLTWERYAVTPICFFIFFLSAPTAYFAFATYSDALFLLTFALSLSLALRDPRTLSRNEAIHAWALLILAPWLRLTAYAFFAWAFFRRYFAVGTLVALVAWLSLNLLIAEDPFHFLKAQAAFAMPAGNIFDGIKEATSGLAPGLSADGQTEWTPWLQFKILPLFYLAALFLSATWFALKRDWIIATTIVAVAIISHNQSFWRSVLRYDLPLMCFLAIPLLTGARGDGPSLQLGTRPRQSLARETWLRLRIALFAGLVLAGFALQIYFARAFRRGAWAF